MKRIERFSNNRVHACMVGVLVSLVVITVALLLDQHRGKFLRNGRLASVKSKAKNRWIGDPRSKKVQLESPLTPQDETHGRNTNSLRDVVATATTRTTTTRTTRARTRTRTTIERHCGTVHCSVNREADGTPNDKWSFQPMWLPYINETRAIRSVEYPSDAAGPCDSQLFLGPNSFCSFKNILFNSTHTIFLIEDEMQRISVEATYKYDCVKEKDVDVAAGRTSRLRPWCVCFHSHRQLAVVGMDTWKNIMDNTNERSCGHTWALEQYSQRHHYGHFMETAVSSSSILGHSKELFGGRGFTDVVFLKTAELYSAEREAFTIAKTMMEGASPTLEEHFLSQGRTLWSKRATMTLHKGTIAADGETAKNYRRAAFSHFGFRESLCPPRSVALLYRDTPSKGRRMSNINQVTQLLEELTQKSVTVTTLNGSHSLQDQAKFFNQHGLILASHSSQLLSMVFAQPNTAIIEVVPLFYVWDFGVSARLLDLNYFISVGSSLDFPTISKQLASMPSAVGESIERMGECGGVWECVLDVPWCANKLSQNNIFSTDHTVHGYCVKLKARVKLMNNFEADLQVLRQSIGHAVSKLNDACGGNW